MALYTNELAAEAMREKARAEIERAKRMASLERERTQREQQASPGGSHSMSASALQTLSKAELYGRAKQIGVRGRSKMSKQELIEAIRHDL